jgi:hypothetical protein
MNTWATRLAPELARGYNIEEIHNVWFLPKDWHGCGPVVELLIPECELQYVMPSTDGEPLAIINRPQKNKNVDQWLRCACRMAVEIGACLSLACDTAKQAEQTAREATRHLPGYERVALERMYRAEDRVRGALS